MQHVISLEYVRAWRFLAFSALASLLLPAIYLGEVCISVIHSLIDAGVFLEMTGRIIFERMVR